MYDVAAETVQHAAQIVERAADVDCEMSVCRCSRGFKGCPEPVPFFEGARFQRRSGSAPVRTRWTPPGLTATMSSSSSMYVGRRPPRHGDGLQACGQDRRGLVVRGSRYRASGGQKRGAVGFLRMGCDLHTNQPRTRVQGLVDRSESPPRNGDDGPDWMVKTKGHFRGLGGS